MSIDLSPEELDISQRLPKSFPSVELTGQKFKLLPFEPQRDSLILYQRMNGSSFELGTRKIDNYDCNELVWKYLPVGPFSNPGQLSLFIEDRTLKENQTFFTVFDLESASQIGIFGMMRNEPWYLKVEIGSIIFCPLAQGTGAILETCYLLLGYCFGIGYRRVEWKCNSLNERSKRAAEKIGFKFEMVQEGHMITKGMNRDTLWFRILKPEWLDVKRNLEEKMINLS